jgi:hypothetical protein
MPLGAFKLNGLSKLFSTIAGWATWDGTKDSPNLSLAGQCRSLCVINDSRLIGLIRSQGRIQVFNRTDNSISSGGTTSGLWTWSTDNDGPPLIVSASDGSNAYFFNNDNNQIIKVFNITSSSVQASNQLSISLNTPASIRPILCYVDSSNGNFVMFGTQNGVVRRIRVNVSGTTTITASTTDFTFSGITGNVMSIARINNTTAIAITFSGTSVYAYRLFENTATQIGTAITTSGTFPPTATNNDPFRQQDLKGFCVYANYVSGNSWRIFKATETEFTSFTADFPFNSTNTISFTNNSSDDTQSWVITRLTSGVGPNLDTYMWKIDHQAQTVGPAFTYSRGSLNLFGIRELNDDYMVGWANDRIRLIVK